MEESVTMFWTLTWMYDSTGALTSYEKVTSVIQVNTGDIFLVPVIFVL